MSNSSYRPDIDGLRALAVLAVILFHAELGLSGGYVGVDVFFVISGFLITSLIVRDLEQQRFSFRTFWERRIRRICPAVACMVLVTLVAGWFLLLPNDYDQLGESAAAQAALMANVHFWHTSGYFNPAAEDQPLLHTWSLAVEEQFYLVWPLLLYITYRLRLIRRNMLCAACLGFLCVAGIGIAQFGVEYHHVAAFYLLPARAWELLCGATLALLPATSVIASPTWRELASWVGLSGIVVPACLYTSETPFPGIAAVPPCLGTALLIWANMPHATKRTEPTLLARVLSLRAIVFIGLVSYSLYLWHWPIFVFSKYWTFHPFTILERLGLVVLSFLLAILSWRFVETPFRKREPGFNRASVFSFAAVSTAIVIAAGVFVHRAAGVPSRVPERVLAASTPIWPEDKSDLTTKVFKYQAASMKLVTRAAIDDPPVDFFIWGDSHADVAMSAFRPLLHELDASGVGAFWYRCPPVVDESFGGTAFLNKLALKQAESVIDYIRAKKIKNTFLVAHWELYEAIDRERLKSSIQETADRLSATGTHTWIVLDAPSHDLIVPRALARNAYLKTDDHSWQRTPAEHHRRNSVLYELMQEPIAAKFLDPSVLLLEPNKEHYRVQNQGMPLYFDTNHMTAEGTKIAILPLLRDHFSEAHGSN